MRRATLRLLLIAPMPPPVTGQSVASDAIRSHLQNELRMQVDVVNLSKASLRSGMEFTRRVGEVFGIFLHVARRVWFVDVIYFTIAESRAGNVKDLILYLLCLPKLRRMVVHLHGGAGMKGLLAPGNSVVRACNSWFLRRVNSVVVLGESQRSIFDGVAPPDALRVVRNFAAEDLFIAEQDVKAKFRDDGPLRVVFLSNLIEGKGHLELLEAALDLEPEVRNGLVVEFAGAFSSAGEQEDFCNRISGHPNIRYRGVVSGKEKAELLKHAHVFCLPTYYAYEGQPISILEAYASGCAVITTDHSGIPDVFVPRANGIGVPPRSVGALKAALLECTVDRPALEAYGTRNLGEARAWYRSDRYCSELAALIGDAATH